MSLLGTFRIAIRALLRNRLRSILTMLGIIIGVSAFVAAMAIGQGASARITTSIAGMGSNMLVIWPGSMQAGGARGGMGSGSTLTVADAVAIEILPAVWRSALIVRASGQVVWGATNWFTQVQGTTPAYLDVRNWKVARGEPLSEDDVRGAAKVCLIGQTVVKNLFGDADPLGQEVRVRNLGCTVKGVLAEKGSNGFGSDEDDTVLMPYTTVRRKMIGGDPQLVNSVSVSAVSPTATAAAQRQIEELLRQRHQIYPGQPDDFTVRDLREVAQQFTETTKTFTVLLSAIAAISLLVGGIGIMNIMLVSVTERTREIGIRVAIGARARDIRTQFLVEAVVLSLLGGLTGIALGSGGAKLLGQSQGWTILVDPTTLLVSFGFAALVGVVFGLYPALRASKLDPIDALRYE